MRSAVAFRPNSGFALRCQRQSCAEDLTSFRLSELTYEIGEEGNPIEPREQNVDGDLRLPNALESSPSRERRLRAVEVTASFAFGRRKVSGVEADEGGSRRKGFAGDYRPEFARLYPIDQTLPECGSFNTGPPASRKIAGLASQHSPA